MSSNPSQATAMAVILDLVRYGLASISDAELAFDGRVYAFDDRHPDWPALAEAVSWSAARAADAKAQGERVSPNTNCLEGVKCPSCGNTREFRIEVTTMATVTDEGSDIDAGAHEWDKNSWTMCTECDESGDFWQFTQPKHS